MGSRRAIAAGWVVGALVAGLLVACTGSERSRGASPADRGAVRIASFDFTESEVVAELYAQALEGEGIAVARFPQLGSREVVEPALQQDQVDLVPEYLGSALEFLTLGQVPAPAESRDAHTELRAAMGPLGIEVLAHAPGEDQNGVAVTAKTAQRLALESISDLAPVARSLVFAGPAECGERPRCLPGLDRVYDLTFASFETIPPGSLTALALANGEVDVAVMFTTDPNVADQDLVLLRDDRGLQPPEHVVPVVREEVLDRYGDVVTVTIDAVTTELTTDELTELNRAVDLEGRPAAGVARDWLRARGLADG